MQVLEDNVPFVEALAAPRKSGKSFLLKQQLKKFVKTKTFKKIYILCQSLDKNNDYDEFRVDPKKPKHQLTEKEKYLKKTFVFVKKPTQRIIENIMAHMDTLKEDCINAERYDTYGANKECPHILIVLDDVLDTGLLNRQNICDVLAERGRHMNISVALTSQILRKISLNIRENSEILLFFSPFSVRELEKYLEEFIPIEYKKYAKQKFVEIFDKKYFFVLVDNNEKSILKKVKYGNADMFMQNRLLYFLDGYIPDVNRKRSRDEEQHYQAKKRKKYRLQEEDIVLK